MRFQHGSAMSFCMVKVPEIAKYAFSALIRSVVLRMMVAEMAEYAFSARIRNVLLNSGDCRDGRICVFSADPQGLFTF